MRDDADTRRDTEFFLSRFHALIQNFEKELESGALRPKVLALIPIFHSLRSLGKSLLPDEHASAAINRILYYFQKFPQSVIKGDELLVVSGIQEYTRRVRQLRVESGWSIASGMTIRDMSREGEEVPQALCGMKPNEYILLNTEQDREASHRWNIANTIRKKKDSVHDKILEYLRENVSRAVTNEELRYVAGNKTEWARRVRELRTEDGWPVATKTTGRPDLPVGVYILEADRQSPKHDRHIPDDIRREVLRSENYRCTQCDWSHDDWNRSDPRHLELHHIKHHVKGGENVRENLRTLCMVCHDQLHKTEQRGK